MKRDLDLVRAILLYLEEDSDPRGWVDVSIPDFNDEQISYHVMLLYDAGLIDAINLSTTDEFDWRPRRLTWEGHEFLDAARDNTRWQRAKEIMLEKGGGFALDILKEVLLRLMRDSVLP